MALINRVARLFRADLHAVLDRLEEPELVLRQAVRDMEQALAEDQRQLRALELEQGQVAKRLANLDRALADLEPELDACFQAGKEDLARALVRRRLEAEQTRRVLVRRRETLADRHSELSARVAERRDRVEAMRQSAEVLAAEQAPTEPEERWAGVPESGVRAEDVEVAFLLAKQQRSKTL